MAISYDAFKNPERKYAIYPIIHARLQNQQLVDNYDKRWFAGVVGNVDYDTPDFPNDDTVWRAAADGARAYLDRGMQVWLYDEKGYPSGTAGGYVTEEYPDYIAKGLYCFRYWLTIKGPRAYRSDVPGDALWRALLLPVGGGDPIDVTYGLNDKNVLHFDVPAGEYRLLMLAKRRLFDGTHATESHSEPRNYISLSNRAATQAFINCTHENYKRHLSDCFGRGIPATFTDEPSLIAWNINKSVWPMLPWLDSYPDDFYARYGYDFALACVAVVWGAGEQVIKRRCDFWNFIADTVADSYFATIQQWCHQNGLKSSGHMLEEERLQSHVFNYGSFFRCMQHMDWPGIDQLQTEPEKLMDLDNIPIARFIASFADLSGEHETFTEFSDHGVRVRGKVAPIEYYYHSTNWHLAMGINNFTSYYSWDGITDDQAYDLNHYVARGGYLLRQGIRDSRVAVLYPEASMWAAYTPTTTYRAIDNSPHTQALDKAFATAAWDLLREQVDFDYIDQKILCECELKDGKLYYRDRVWSAVVLPAVDVLEDTAAEKLLSAAASGVSLLFCDQLPQLSRESGAPSAFAEQFQALVADQAAHFAPTDGFAALLDQQLPDACHSVRLSGKHDMLLSHSRITQDGERIVFLTNMGAQDYCGDMVVYGSFASVHRASLADGTVQPIEATSCEGGVTLPIHLATGQALFFILQ